MEDARSVAHTVISRLVAAYNAKDLDGLMSLYGPDPCYWSALGGSREGTSKIAEHLRELFTALPDERMSADTVVTDGAAVVAEFTSRGATPTGDPYCVTFTEVITLRDGAIVDVKVYIDPAELPPTP